MYIKEVTEIDNLIFHKNPPKKPKYKQAEKLFGEDWKDIVLPEPPKNSSRQTMDELEDIAHRQSMLTDFEKQVYKNTDHDTSYYIKEFLEEQDLEWSEDEMEKIMDSVKHIGRHYKNRYNRPRPSQVAKKLGVKIDSLDTDTINSRSYIQETAMDWKLLATVFTAVLVAEMADKTQLVTMLFAADRAVSKWTVFLGSASALILTSAIGVLAGTLLSQVVNVKMMSVIAGCGFILIGAWTLYHGLYRVT